jgi:hypothetical protein
MSLKTKKLSLKWATAYNGTLMVYQYEQGFQEYYGFPENAFLDIAFLGCAFSGASLFGWFLTLPIHKESELIG